ncbi:lipoma-preferred partner homolog isoform X2 [Latimeria chalumnae]|uniref:lipoma-preferred partner homolog isoform X2 n=1 Tax=Latimeria chalumnae TaxID=7897 RepID=UPI0006D8F3EF|nr:PREDICTED: lipoma-preferred partner homolog isoform X2 [Latimeria chalumnae]|eukprot:XP_014346154.1 PREDICTED: lipoma-preferred partner homolog isoform X2 [Latimeria chalumnae]
MSGPTWLPPKNLSSTDSVRPSAVPANISVSTPNIYKPQKKFSSVPAPAPKPRQASYEENGGISVTAQLPGGTAGGSPKYITSPTGGLPARSHLEDSGTASAGGFRPLVFMSGDHYYPAAPAGKEDRGCSSRGSGQAVASSDLQNYENLPYSTVLPSQAAGSAPKPTPGYKQPPVAGQLTYAQIRPTSYGTAGHGGGYGAVPKHVAYGPPPQPTAYGISAPSSGYNVSSQPVAYSPSQPGGHSGSQPPGYHMPMGLKPFPQPVAASYTTASTSTGPTFNVQVKAAQPVPHYTQPGRMAEHAHGPSSPRQRDPGYGHQPSEPTYRMPQPKYLESAYGVTHQHPEMTHPPPSWYQLPQYASGASSQQLDPGYGAVEQSQDRGYRQHGARRAEPDYYGSGPKVGGQYQPPGRKKSTEELPPAPPAPMATGGYPAKAPVSRPEEELDHLTKKLVYDMNNPPTDEYFGRCFRCGENVIGDGTGCIAMEQVFHVDCFACMNCHCPLRGQPFYAMEKKSYCEACYIVTLEKCSVCSKPIMDRILRAMGKAYHPQCFTCVVCHRCLDGVPFTVDATSQIHCIEDFHRKFAPRCSVCGKAIMPEPGQEETVRIVALDRSFHINCYKCEVSICGPASALWKNSRDGDRSASFWFRIYTELSARGRREVDPVQGEEGKKQERAARHGACSEPHTQGEPKKPDDSVWGWETLPWREEGHKKKKKKK